MSHSLRNAWIEIVFYGVLLIKINGSHSLRNAGIEIVYIGRYLEIKKSHSLRNAWIEISDET